MAASAHARTLPVQLSTDELKKIVKPADIILTRTSGAVSGVIQKGSCSKYSHAILALPNAQCVEAVTPVVRKESLEVVLDGKTYAALFRHKLLPEGMATNTVCNKTD